MYAAKVEQGIVSQVIVGKPQNFQKPAGATEFAIKTTS